MEQLPKVRPEVLAALKDIKSISPDVTADARGTVETAPPAPPAAEREAGRTAKLRKSLPRGIAIGKTSDRRKSPFYVRHGRDRHMKTFASESERNDRAEQLALDAREQGTDVLNFDPRHYRAFVDFCTRTGATLPAMEKLWALHSASIADGMPVKEAVAKYLKLRLAEDIKENSDTYRHMKKHLLEVLCGALGRLPLNRVTADMLRELLARLKNRKGKGPATNTTKFNYRKDWRTFFARAVRERWTKENPCDIVVPPKAESKEIQFLSLKDAFHFFKEAVNFPIGRRLALEAFAGLRVSSAARMEEVEIRLKNRSIILPAEKHKMGERNVVQGYPTNLDAWHDLAGQRWDIGESYYDQIKGKVFAAAKVRNTGNVLRHSFATYHVAFEGNAAKTATIMTHHNPTMLYRHYNGRCESNEEAKAYFTITPETVKLSWEEFQTINNLKSEKPALVESA